MEALWKQEGAKVRVSMRKSQLGLPKAPAPQGITNFRAFLRLNARLVLDGEMNCAMFYLDVETQLVPTLREGDVDMARAAQTYTVSRA